MHDLLPYYETLLLIIQLEGTLACDFLYETDTYRSIAGSVQIFFAFTRKRMAQKIFGSIQNIAFSIHKSDYSLDLPQKNRIILAYDQSASESN